MGFMDKARKLAEQAQQKLDEGQDQLNAAQPPAPAPAPPSGLRDVDRSHEAPPALTSGDPLAG